MTAMCGGDKDRAARVPSLTNEEPLVVVEPCVDIVWEVIRENCSDSRDSVVREGKAPLCRGGYGSVCEGTCSAKDRDVGCGRGVGGHRGSNVFASGGRDEDVVGIYGDVLVERGEEESVEYFLGYARRCGGHGWRG